MFLTQLECPLNVITSFFKKRKSQRRTVLSSEHVANNRESRNLEAEISIEDHDRSDELKSSWLQEKVISLEEKSVVLKVPG